MEFKSLMAALAVCMLVVALAHPAEAKRHSNVATSSPGAAANCQPDNNGRTACHSDGRGSQARSAGAASEPRRRGHQAHGQRGGDVAAFKSEPVKGQKLSSLVALINYKLARYVHPTGKCGGSSEQLATYYWQGSRTATGERYNPHGHSVASRTLPFGTMLNITNPHNGRSVTVRVNDRGPYTNAKLDLSLGAAQTLGLKQSSYVCVSSL